MKVLGIETATTVCGVAIAEDGTVLAQAEIEERRVHAEKLLTLIDDVLREAHSPLREMDGIAVSIGPGSFTGLRIGLSVGKGLVFATEGKLIAVPTLEALALRASEATGIHDGSYVLPMLDARRDDVYCQLFRMEQGSVAPVWGARDLHLPEVMQATAGYDVLLTGDAVGKMKLFLADQKPVQRARYTFVGDQTARCDAGTVARIGERLLGLRQTADPRHLEPWYIKEFFSPFETHGKVSLP